MSTKKTKEESIIICPKCEGKGIVCHEKMVDYHHREYETICEPCPDCDTKGRLIQTIEIKTTLTKLSDK